MLDLRFLAGFLLLWVVADDGLSNPSVADDKFVKGAASLKDDLTKLQGKWKQLRPSQPGYVYLEFDNESLYIAHVFECVGNAQATPHGADGVSSRGESVDKFKLKEHGKRRALIAEKKGVSLSTIIYRFDADTLVIEDGTCSIFEGMTGNSYEISLSGEWKRLRGDLEKLQGQWKPVKPLKGDEGELGLEFAWESLQVAGIPAERDESLKLDLQSVMFELRERDKKRLISFVRKKKPSSFTYRFDGDSLIIEDGEWSKVSLRGEWKRVKRERVRAVVPP
jgi:hypothetical protein